MSLVAAACCHGNVLLWACFIKSLQFMWGNSSNRRLKAPFRLCSWGYLGFWLGGRTNTKGNLQWIFCFHGRCCQWGDPQITALGWSVTSREIIFSCRCFFSTVHGTVALESGVMEWPLQLLARIDFHSHCSSTLPERISWSVTVQCWRAFHSPN